MKHASPAANQLLKALSCIVQIQDKALPKTLAQKLMVWGQESMPLIQEFGVSPALWRQIIKDTANNVDPQETSTFAKSLSTLSRLLLDSKTTVRKSQNTSHNQAQFIADACLYLRTESAVAYARLYAEVPTLGDKCLNLLWTQDDGNQLPVPAELREELEKAAKAITRKRNVLTAKQLEHYKQHKSMPRYKKALKACKTMYLNRLETMLIDAGATYLPVNEVIADLEVEGIMHFLPTGFTGGNVGQDGMLYTSVGKPIGKHVLKEVRVNPDYDPIEDNTWVFEGKTSSSLRKYYTHKELDIVPVKTSDISDISYIRKVLPALSGCKQDLISEENMGLALAVSVAQLLKINPLVVAANVGRHIIPLLNGDVFIRLQGRVVRLAAKPATRKEKIVRYITEKRVRDALIQLKRLQSMEDEDTLLFTYKNKPITEQVLNKYFTRLGCPKELKANTFVTVLHSIELEDALGKAEFDLEKRDFTDKEVKAFYTKQKDRKKALPSVGINYFNKYSAAVPKELRPLSE